MFAVQEKFFLWSEPKDIMEEFILLLQEIMRILEYARSHRNNNHRLIINQTLKKYVRWHTKGKETNLHVLNKSSSKIVLQEVQLYKFKNLVNQTKIKVIPLSDKYNKKINKPESVWTTLKSATNLLQS